MRITNFIQFLLFFLPFVPGIFGMIINLIVLIISIAIAYKLNICSFIDVDLSWLCNRWVQGLIIYLILQNVVGRIFRR